MMPETCVLPRFSRRRVVAAVKKLYGLEGQCQPLNGERDLNYLITASTGRYLFKIANRAEKIGMLECQHQVFERLARSRVFELVPASVRSLDGKVVETVTADDGVRHYARVVGYLEGRLLSAVNPHTPELLESLGERLALLDKSLDGFTHAALERPLLWEMHRADAVVGKFAPLLAAKEHRALVDYFTDLYQTGVSPVAGRLRRGVIHNDANDNNVLVAGDRPWAQRVVSIIDYGDMTVSWIAADAAIAAAYAMLGTMSGAMSDKAPRPLEAAASVIRGYHRNHPLTEVEISVLFELMCMRLTMSVCICAHQQSVAPDNDYLRISAQSAWDALRLLRQFSPCFAHFALRAACDLEPVPNSPAVVGWLRAAPDQFSPLVNLDLARDELLPLDTSVASPDVGAPGEPADPEILTRRLFRAIDDNACAAAIGRYGEYRLIYAGENFNDVTGHRRTLHLGIDVFMPAGSPVFAPLEGVVHSVANHDAPLDYGGTLILAHRVTDAQNKDQRKEITFYTLYGHLAPASLNHLKKGAKVEAGQPLAQMGGVHENGRWPPHVHFQIITDLLEQAAQADTFAGVGTHQHRRVWLSLCPDPNLILRIPTHKLAAPAPVSEPEEMLDARRHSLLPSLRLAYRRPISVARGAMQYLYDATGRRYLDAVNNVPHVGHCHPTVVAAERRQAGILNTNTRYLHAAIAEYSARLLQTFPEPLCVCCLVCSGSEANDLALRMARCHTERRDVVVLEHAYHGNLSALIEVSPYKHDGAGGAGAPGYVHTAAIPDGYRGKFKGKGKAAAVNYAKDVARALEDAAANGGAAAFLAESVLGCGGQVVLPAGYLQAAYAHARRAGAVCIADEVQVGFGRVGSHFWGFQTQGRAVVPDIVTLGKPIGNGHPMAAVITTREIADSFDNGMEYFNTFGGNPVSCAVGHAVLDVIEEQQLRQNALSVGDELRAGLGALQSRFPLLGEVRGLGLFIGVELVNDRDSLAPAAAQADYIAERMKQEGILIGTDGPWRNVLKIKPPLCFSQDNAAVLVETVEMILREDFAQPVGTGE